MAEMKSITFCNRAADFTSPGRTHFLTYAAIKFIIDMKWLIIGHLDEALELLIGDRERVTKTTCCVDIQTYMWRGIVVPGFCTKQARVNGQVVYVLVNRSKRSNRSVWNA